MCIRDRSAPQRDGHGHRQRHPGRGRRGGQRSGIESVRPGPVSYTHLRAHETVLDLVCRLLLEKQTHIKNTTQTSSSISTKTHN